MPGCEVLTLVRFPAPLVRSYEVAILDSLVRRTMDAQLGFDTLTPISSIHHRLAAWKVRRRRGRAKGPHEALSAALTHLCVAEPDRQGHSAVRGRRLVRALFA